MFTHLAPEAEVVSDSDSDSSTSGEERLPSTFQRDWPYASIIKKELGADEYEAVETTETFGTGRRKYDIIFYSKATGVRVEISRHVGMKLTSRTGVAYLVCKRTPKDVIALPATQPRATPPQASTMVPPRPSLLCCNCVCTTHRFFLL